MFAGFILSSQACRFVPITAIIIQLSGNSGFKKNVSVESKIMLALKTSIANKPIPL